MADILIRGVEMPKSCGECPFYRLESAGNGMYLDYCAGKRGIVYDPDNERESDCPLIALPEGHGRLVDIDVLKKRLAEILEKAKIPYTFPTWNDAVAEICTAPTIVPAEKGDV